ncbi:hypothetical protein DW083_14005 [Parabacteroides sp. AF48-14]|nr:hypothetical protein DW083_14005 [Parabacteroides sp. AF48-14]
MNLCLQNFGKDKSYISNVQDNDWFFLVIDRQVSIKHKTPVLYCMLQLYSFHVTVVFLLCYGWISFVSQL